MILVQILSAARRKAENLVQLLDYTDSDPVVEQQRWLARLEKRVIRLEEAMTNNQGRHADFKSET